MFQGALGKWRQEYKYDPVNSFPGQGKLKPLDDELRGLVVHSDRSVQYCCDAFKKLLSLYGITQSMSRKGNCWDNIEMFYNRQRLHSANNYISPVDAEKIKQRKVA